jgi:hypothetical protein
VGAITLSSPGVITGFPRAVARRDAAGGRRRRRLVGQAGVDSIRVARFRPGALHRVRVFDACDPGREGPLGMLTAEDDVEIHALAARGWSVSAIRRHTGRDLKTIRKSLAGAGARQNRERAPSCQEPFRGYIQARFVEDPHLEATVLLHELVDVAFDHSYRRRCASCAGSRCGRSVWSASTNRGEQVTVEIEHPPRRGDPVGLARAARHAVGEPAFLLLGALSDSGRFGASSASGWHRGGSGGGLRASERGDSAGLELFKEFEENTEALVDEVPHRADSCSHRLWHERIRASP